MTYKKPPSKGVFVFGAEDEIRTRDGSAIVLRFCLCFRKGLFRSADFSAPQKFLTYIFGGPINTNVAQAFFYKKN